MAAKLCSLSSEHFSYSDWYILLSCLMRNCCTLPVLRAAVLRGYVKADPGRWTGSLGPLETGTEAMQKWVTPGTLSDPDVVLYAARIAVWGRWFAWLVCVFLLAYRPGVWYPEDIGLLPLTVLLGMVNGLVHHRLLTNRSVTWRWMLLLSVTEIVLVTVAIVIGDGFRSFIFLAFYPSLAVVAVVFSSNWLSLAWTTAVAVVYAVVCVRVGSGLDLDAGDEKELVARLAVMYTLVMGITVITRFERIRWRASVTGERALRRERIELSQTIHDTTAQTAYMIGLGIHRARELAGEANEELVAALDATSALSRSAMWEVRGPIDAGHILEGRELGRLLWSHCATFERITGVQAEMSQSGTEPPLSTETRTRLFSIAHNALTNAFLHARPGRVEVRLSFAADQIRLSVSDDGVGLPDGYAERGRGFNGMRSDAEQLGGVLIVESGEGVVGTTVACVVPDAVDRSGG